MSTFDDLIMTLVSMRKDVARFHNVVLHLHSPDSHEYGRGFDGVAKVKDKSEDAFQAGIEKCGLSMVAVTDHMKSDFACRLSKSLAGKGICVLPGMEINFRPPAPWNSFRVHILTIFPECHAHEHITRILPPAIPAEGSRSGNEEITNMDLASFVKTVHKHGGLCIAAHIDTDNGIRKTFRQLGQDGILFCAANEILPIEQQRKISEEFKEWLFLAGFDAIEVASDKDRPHYRWISNVQGKRVSIPAILRNDSYCIEDLGDKTLHTHIKMAKACFQDLKRALEFPDTRVRFPIDVPSTPTPSILGLEIVSAEGKGFFTTLQIAFSDNLSCFIGPRGSGKSAIIESLRYAFGLNRMLGQIEQSGTDLVKTVRSLQAATLAGSVIRIVYKRTDNEVNILEATFDPKQDYATRVYDITGNALEIADVQASGGYPIRLFGWSEIETLGREPQRQRDLLDRLIPDLTSMLDKRTELRSKMAEERREVESSTSRLTGILRKNSGEIRRYKEYKADFEKLNTPEIDSLFVAIDAAKEKQTILGKLRGNAVHWLGELDQVDTQNILDGVEDVVKELSEPTRAWWRTSELRTTILGQQTQAEDAVKKLTGILGAVVQELNKSMKALDDEVHNREMKVREKIGQEVTKQVAADLRRTADERLQRANQLRREYNDEWIVFNQCLNKWKSLAEELVKWQSNIGQLRQKQKDKIEGTLNQYSTKDMTISILFAPGRDRGEFIDHLNESGILTKDAVWNYKASRLAWRISLLCTPIELAKSLLSNDASRIMGTVKIKDIDVEVDTKTASALVSSVYPFRHDEEADVPSVDSDKLERILRSGEVEWDDVESILLNSKPVDTLSPGQRSSAMLPLIALVGNAPLIIDQPEDNLDNRLVGKMLVDVLASLKEKRQIIVATHNPNIVVSGDSEQVIVLDALSGDKGTCKFAGSIDKPEIVNWVIDIMEGGKEAFRVRSKRYEPHLNV
jgi:DNA repair ATPase RecN